MHYTRGVQPYTQPSPYLAQHIEGLKNLYKTQKFGIKLFIHPGKYFVKQTFKKTWHTILVSATHVGHPFITVFELKLNVCFSFLSMQKWTPCTAWLNASTTSTTQSSRARPAWRGSPARSEVLPEIWVSGKQPSKLHFSNIKANTIKFTNVSYKLLSLCTNHSIDNTVLKSQYYLTGLTHSTILNVYSKILDIKLLVKSYVRAYVTLITLCPIPNFLKFLTNILKFIIYFLVLPLLEGNTNFSFLKQWVYFFLIVLNCVRL